MSAADLAVVRRNFLTRNPAALARYDVNADGVVNAFDLAVVRSNLGRDLAVVAAPAPGARRPGGRLLDYAAHHRDPVPPRRLGRTRGQPRVAHGMTGVRVTSSPPRKRHLPRKKLRAEPLDRS
jgi:hypothetical protein